MNKQNIKQPRMEDKSKYRLKFALPKIKQQRKVQKNYNAFKK